MTERQVRVTVVYAEPGVTHRVELKLTAGATVRVALSESRLSETLGLDLTLRPVGIYGKLCALDEVLSDGDRVEIYRALTIDPKLARQRRAKRIRRRP